MSGFEASSVSRNAYQCYRAVSPSEKRLLRGLITADACIGESTKEEERGGFCLEIGAEWRTRVEVF